MRLENLVLIIHSLIEKRNKNGHDSRFIDIMSEEFAEFDLEDQHWYFDTVRKVIYTRNSKNLLEQLEVLFSQDISIVRKSFWTLIHEQTEFCFELSHFDDADTTDKRYLNTALLIALIETNIICFFDVIEFAVVKKHFKLIESLAKHFPSKLCSALFSPRIKDYPQGSLKKIISLICASPETFEELQSHILSENRWPKPVFQNVIQTCLIEKYEETMDLLTKIQSLDDTTLLNLSASILKSQSPVEFLDSCQKRHQGLVLKLLQISL